MNLVGGEVGADILPKFLIPDIGLAGGQKIGALGADVEVDKASTGRVSGKNSMNVSTRCPSF